MKKLGFGCMRLPVLDPGDVTTIDMPQFEKMVDTFLERGFTYFDTAYVYHSVTSEKAVREALVKRHPGTASPWLPSCRSSSWGKLRIWTSTLPNSWKTAA